MSGFFGGLKRELDLAAKTVNREVNDVSKQLGISSTRGPLVSGLFNNLMKEADSAAKSISRDVDRLVTGGQHQYDQIRSSPVLDLFRSGNVIQLVSRSSGKSLEIVMSPAGSLVLDGMGPEGPTIMHAHWTVINDGNNIIRLHNQTNFLAIRDGTTQLIDCPNFGLTVEESKFRLSQTGQFITLESYKSTGKHVGILASGEIKSALACGKESDAHFGVRLIYAAPVVQHAAPVVHAAAGPGTTVVTTTTYAQKK